jgi:hypothetical protein
MDLRLNIRDDLIASHERGLYRRAWLLLNLLAPGLRLFGMMRCLRSLRFWANMPGRCQRSDNPLRRAKEITRVVQVATWRSAFQADCLETSLAIWYFLRREGIDGDLCMGTRFAGDGFQAHTWVEVQDQVVSERTDPRLRYVPFDRPISAFRRSRP